MITSVTTRSMELGMLREQSLGVVAVGRFQHPIAGLVEDAVRELAHAGLVLDEQHRLGRAAESAAAGDRPSPRHVRCSNAADTL